MSMVYDLIAGKPDADYVLTVTFEASEEALASAVNRVRTVIDVIEPLDADEHRSWVLDQIIDLGVGELANGPHLPSEEDREVARRLFAVNRVGVGSGA